jgi:predicted HicB family RNase H-like nuclease
MHQVRRRKLDMSFVYKYTSQRDTRMIRIDSKLVRKLKVMAARDNTTIRRLVEDCLIDYYGRPT